MSENSETKWTPGPWQVGNHGQFGTFNPAQVFATSKEAVAQVYGIPLHATLEDIDPVRYAEGLANAQLIAAAPELYNELFRALAVINSPESFDLEQVKNDIAAALRSARGTR